MPSTSGSIMSVTTASGRQRPEDLLAARADERGSHLVARMLEQDLQPLGHRRLIVDGEDALLPFQTHPWRMYCKRAASQYTRDRDVSESYTLL